MAASPHCPIANPNSCAPQDALSNKGFGTDLPLVNSQVEEHNIFHNEVMAIGPHIVKEGSKVSSPAPLPAALQGQPCPEPWREGRVSHHPGFYSPEQVWVGVQIPSQPESPASHTGSGFTVRQILKSTSPSSLNPHPSAPSSPCQATSLQTLLLTPALLLLQENLSDFQAKYQKLLVRTSGILEEEPSWGWGGQAPLGDPQRGALG